jgi:hypothetical protein
VKHFDENPSIAAPFSTTFKKLAAISARRLNTKVQGLALPKEA